MGYYEWFGGEGIVRAEVDVFNVVTLVGEVGMGDCCCGGWE